VSVAGLSTPFEGKVRLTLSRNTTDGMSAVAVIEEELCSTETSATVEVIWNGAVDRDVPRQVSNRTTPDLNPGKKPTNIPLREMGEDSLVVHGLYAVEKIELVEKDDSIAATATPANGGFVVPMVCTLFFNPAAFAASLGRFGIGDGFKIAAPYIEDIRRAIFIVASSYYKDHGLQFFFTHDRNNAAGIMIEILDTQFNFGSSDPGATKILETADTGVDLKSNIFGWEDVTFFKRANGDEFFVRIAPSAMLDRNMDQASDDSKVLNEVFGPLGVAKDSISLPLKDPFGPKPVRPRTVTNGKVDGQVTFTDHNNTSVSLSANAVFTVATIDPSLVPPQRAKEIERALNAITNAVGTLVAHEVGHVMGLVARTSAQKAVIDVAKTIFLSPLAGDDGSHNTKILGELMDNPPDVRFRTMFGPNNRLPLGPIATRYITDCFPAKP
jgi:hypothetical protein